MPDFAIQESSSLGAVPFVLYVFVHNWSLDPRMLCCCFGLTLPQTGRGRWPQAVRKMIVSARESWSTCAEPCTHVLNRGLGIPIPKQSEGDHPGSIAACTRLLTPYRVLTDLLKKRALGFIVSNDPSGLFPLGCFKMRLRRVCVSASL